MNNYRTDAECRYYGSDLNKYIAEYIDHNHTTNNIDCFQYKFVRFSKMFIRFIESKHLNEIMPESQRKGLTKLAEFVNITNNSIGKVINIEVCIVRGNYPETSDKQIEFLTDPRNTIVLNDEEFRKWLAFDLPQYK